MRTVPTRYGLVVPAMTALVIAACTGAPGTALELRDAGQPPVQEPASTGNTPVPQPATPSAAIPTGKDSGREMENVQFTTQGWKTNFRKHIIPLREIFSGGPPKDGIPAIDKPQFVGAPEANKWLKDREPVVAVIVAGEANAFPLQILMWHEIVNTVVAGRPLVVTYCPLCNTAIVFDRVMDGQVLDFGTTGNLRFSDLVMYDRETESWWQQITGEAVVGDLTGQKLTVLPSSIVSWADFKSAYPNGLVLSRETGYSRPYGENPYVGYDSSPPFLYRGPTPDGRLSAMERVATVTLGGQDAAFPFSVLRGHPVANYTVGGKDIVVFYRPGTASALDGSDIAESRDVGATGVFERKLDKQALTFRRSEDQVVDAETGSVWDILGQAVAGPLKGKKLTPVVHGNHFWFAWVVFKPNTKVYSP